MADFSDVLGLVYAAAVDNRRWDNALEALCDSLAATSTMWCSYDFKRRTGNIVHAFGCDPKYVRLYAEVHEPLSPWFRTLEIDAPGCVTTSDDVIPDDELVETRFYKDWLQPQNVFHRICAAVKQEDSEIFYIVATRPKDGGNFGDGDRLFLSELIPHLQRALVGNGYLWKLAVSQDVLDCVPFGIITVDKHGRPLFANRVAEGLLHSEQDLYVDSGRLRVKRGDLTARLSQLIADAAITTGNQVHRGGAIMIPRAGRPALWLVVSSLGRRLRKVVGQEDQVAKVFVAVPDHVSRFSAVMLQTYYGLTPAEQRVALLILEGCRLDEAAERLNISHNTARTHMKQIYAKTETDRQADLVRLLLMGPASHDFVSRDSVQESWHPRAPEH